MVVLQTKGLGVWYTKRVLLFDILKFLFGILKGSCYLAHKKGFVIWYTKMVLLFGILKGSCCLVY